MCFSPCHFHKNPGPLPGMEGRKEKGIPGVLMLHFPSLHRRLLGGYLVVLESEHVDLSPGSNPTVYLVQVN